MALKLTTHEDVKIEISDAPIGQSFIDKILKIHTRELGLIEFQLMDHEVEDLIYMLRR